MKIEPDDLEYMTELLMLGETFSTDEWSDIAAGFYSRNGGCISGDTIRKGWLACSAPNGRIRLTDKGKRFIASGGTDGIED